MKHLWEVKHDYYCTRGCYYIGRDRIDEVHCEYDSFDAFLADWNDADFDYNLLFRFDWRQAGPDWELETDQLRLYFFQQRKAKPNSVYVVVKKEEEDKVKQYLLPRLQHLLKLWAPLASSPTSNSSDSH